MAYPGEPRRLSVSTRLGLLHTDDGGRSWKADIDTGDQGGNLFRVGNRVFFSNNRGMHLQRRDGERAWSQIKGPATMVSDGLLLDSALYLKNSRGFLPGACVGVISS